MERLKTASRRFIDFYLMHRDSVQEPDERCLDRSTRAAQLSAHARLVLNGPRRITAAETSPAIALLMALTESRDSSRRAKCELGYVLGFF